MRLSLLALLATAAVVSAQRCDDEDIVIESDGDLKFYAERCRKIGSITFKEDVRIIDFGQIGSVDGSVTIDNATQLTSITGNFLEEIADELKLFSLTRLNTLSLSSLQKVGSISIVTLPAISRIGFSNVTECNSVEISDTVLTALEGINIRSCATFNINNNRYLKDIDIGLQNVTDLLSITFNGIADVKLPKLVSINSTTFGGVGSVEAPNLEEVTGSIEFVNCAIKKFSGPNITSIGDALSFTNNTRLEEIDIPLLEDIGGTLLFANNTIKNITFPNLKEVRGAIDASGSFDKLSLPKLEDVRGGCNIQTSEKLDCKPFDDKESDGTIKGTYLCSAEVDESELGGLGSDPESGTGKKKNGAGQIAFSFTALVVSALFSIAYVL